MIIFLSVTSVVRLSAAPRDNYLSFPRRAIQSLRRFRGSLLGLFSALCFADLYEKWVPVVKCVAAQLAAVYETRERASPLKFPLDAVFLCISAALGEASLRLALVVFKDVLL